MRSKICLVAFGALFLFLASPSLVFAQEPQPGDACSSADNFIRVGGPENPGIGHFLVCDGSNWQPILRYQPDGDVLFGSSGTPNAPLQIDGEVIVGASSGLACNNSRKGGLRYNITSTCLELCDGSSWGCISVAACGDATPDTFDFTDLVNQSISTQVTSNILQITGLGCIVNVEVSGEGSPEYRTCSDSGCSTVVIDWTSGSGTISNNEYIQLRLTTSAAGGDTHSATLAIGTAADVWNATTTGDCTGSPAAGTVCADGTVYAGQSPDGNVKMFTTRCDAGQSWDGSTCTGSRSLLSWNDGDTEWVETGFTSAITGETNTTNIATLDSNSTLSGNQPHIAVEYCNDLNQDGYTDWYLPAKQELDVLYGNNGSIDHFDTSGTYYWSSTEDDNTRAWLQRFNDGNQYDHLKDNTRAVRCVRR